MLLRTKSTVLFLSPNPSRALILYSEQATNRPINYFSSIFTQTIGPIKIAPFTSYSVSLSYLEIRTLQTVKAAKKARTQQLSK
jgi:hypothetical protein